MLTVSADRGSSREKKESAAMILKRLTKRLRGPEYIRVAHGERSPENTVPSPAEMPGRYTDYRKLDPAGNLHGENKGVKPTKRVEYSPLTPAGGVRGGDEPRRGRA